jgi:RNA polymerase sigma factor (sigma-70 family)
MTKMPEKSDFQMKPWLYRVAKNECVDHLRSSGRSRSGLDAEHHPDQTAHGDPHRAAVDRERLAHLVDDMNSLPEKQRASLVLREMSGLGYDEIADSLGTSEAGAKQLVYEARLSLQQAELGRNLGCAEVRASISAMDRRRLRSRKVRSHMRSCDDCSEFERAITARSAEFRSLVPALPVGVAAGILAGVREGGAQVGTMTAGAAGTAAGGMAAGGAATGVVAKGLVAVVVAGGLGAGAAEIHRHQNAEPVTATESRTLDSAPAGSAGPGALIGGRQASQVLRPGDPVGPRAAKPVSRGRSADNVSGPGVGTSGRKQNHGKAEGRSGDNATESGDRLNPGLGNGPGSLPGSSTQGQSRAQQASSAKPGKTGEPQPSRKPEAPPGQTSAKKSTGASDTTGTTVKASPGKSALAPATGRTEAQDKSKIK